MLDVPIRRLAPDVPLPSYQRTGDAGLDLCSTVELSLAPGARALVPTGIAVAIPEGWAGFVQPRSGLALEHGVTVLNSPGLVDSGYRGEIKVLLVNLDRDRPCAIPRGTRIAQLVVHRVEPVRVREVNRLPDSERGAGGFGSTGR